MTLFPAAQCIVAYVKAVGQEASPEAARKRMTAWCNENAGCFGAVKLYVRDLRGHLDATQRVLARTFEGPGKKKKPPAKSLL